MKKRIYFLRSAPYEYKILGKNLYQSFNAVAQRIIDPTLDENHKPTIPEQLYRLDMTVFSSPLQRSVQTAAYVTRNSSALPDLLEVKYAMENFIQEHEFYDQHGIPQVHRARKAFVQALIQNRLVESYQEVIQRIESALKTISKSTSNNILVCSHGFLLKIIEAYIKDQSIRTYPSHLTLYFDGSVETFKFCEGFLVKEENGKLVFDSYLRNEG